ncbi:MAG: hypothetical protein ACOH2N_00585 [Devosia sp.]
MSIEGPAGGRGKWSEPGVPHKGWTCINVEDLGEPLQRCEMCESVDVRHVQYMTHPSYPGTLACGVICAGHMEQNLERAHGRDQTMKSSARRRKAFPDRKGWYENRNGNPQIKLDGCRVTMFNRGGGWKSVVHHLRTGNEAFTRDRIQDIDEAKRAAFDTLTFVLQDAQAAPPRAAMPDLDF